MIDVSTTIQDYIDFVKSRNACDPSIPYLENLITPECQTIADITTAINDGKSSYNPAWAVWSLMNHGDQMTPALQLTLIKRIPHPMEAFSVYRDCILSDEADIELKKMFQGKLPRAEKELEDGVVTRKKVVSNG